MGISRGLLPLLALGGLCLASESGPVPDQSKLYFSDVKPCPVACSKTASSAEWTVYHDTKRLAVCDQPILLEISLYSPLDDHGTDVAIWACTVGNADSTINRLQATNYTAPDAQDSNEPLTELTPPTSLSQRQADDALSCGGKGKKSFATAKLAWWDPVEHDDDVPDRGRVEDAVIAVKKVQEYLKNPANCDRKSIFSYYRGTLVGMFTGLGVDKPATADGLVQEFAETLKTDGLDGRTAVEVCGEDMSAFYTAGVVADVNADFAAVQDIVRQWNDAQCVSDAAGSEELEDVFLYTIVPEQVPIAERSTLLRRFLSPRAECRTIRVVKDDTCGGSLPRRCGIGATAFNSFNRAACAKTLIEGQPMCCSSGTLPDIKPKPGANGACATWDVQPEQYCQMIATHNGLTVTELMEMNNMTWGFSGCDPLPRIKICVSPGAPPMPAPVDNAVCGPTVPNTPFPGADKLLSELNPCPLKTCCNTWGQCGTTEDFCIESESETGSPGTAAKGKPGCISNCGMDIVNNGRGPGQWRKIGYFEGWNFDRDCLNMHVNRIDKSYTHIHFSFGEISPDFHVVIPDKIKDQWEAFKKTTGFRKILAFGGWSFSTDYDTAPIFGQSVSAANRELFADRVAQFAIDNQLDGVDFDWEYPGVTDIPGVPGHKDDGKNYLEFLRLVKRKLHRSMTLSIAAPASYWYLKPFPIEDMAQTLDYIIYMTYDLHGKCGT